MVPPPEPQPAPDSPELRVMPLDDGDSAPSPPSESPTPPSAPLLHPPGPPFPPPDPDTDGPSDDPPAEKPSFPKRLKEDPPFRIKVIVITIIAALLLAAFAGIAWTYGADDDTTDDVPKEQDTGDELPDSEPPDHEEPEPPPDDTPVNDTPDDPPVEPPVNDTDTNDTKPPPVEINYPPANLTYDPADFNLTIGLPMTEVTPSYDGDNVTFWEVKPDLPDSLTLNVNTGEVGGTPDAAMERTTFSVSAYNIWGSDTADITITVIDIPPIISYPDSALVLTKGLEMSPATPEVSGGTPLTWETSPPLPDGLSIHKTTGTITGAPAGEQDMTEYTVYANNSGGTGSAVLNIGVIDIAPDSLSYDPSVQTLFIAEPMPHMGATISGGPVTAWAIDPALPAGLTFNTSSGDIDGTPEELSPMTLYDVNASNSGGSVNVTIAIAVVDRPPDSITYPESEIFAAKGRAMDPATPAVDALNVTGWQVTPPLPDGLAMDPLTGEISGEPTARSPYTEYTVTAGNTGGSASAKVHIMTHDLELDRSELLSGISQVHPGGGYPSTLILHGDFAFSLANNSQDKIIGAAARYGQGAIIGYGHESLMTVSNGYDNYPLVANAVGWLTTNIFPDVGVTSDLGVVEMYLTFYDCDTVTSNPGSLAGLDAFVTTNMEYSPGELASIAQFVWNGGVLVTGGQAWWWEMQNDDPAVTHYPGNKIIPAAGITWSHRWVYPDAYNCGGYPHTMMYNAVWGMDALLADMTGGPSLTQAEEDRAAFHVGDAVDYLPLSLEEFYDTVYTFEQSAGPISITSGNSFDMDADQVETLLLKINSSFAHRLPPDELFAHKDASDFPGAVPGSASVVNQKLAIDGTYEGYSTKHIYSGAGAPVWRSTGLYAIPGAPVTVTIPGSLAGQGLDVQVGSHTDRLWGRTSVDRHPDIVRREALDSAVTTTGNAFGGLIYIRVPVGSTLGDFEVWINGSVRAPRYVHGETSLSQWQSTIRNYPGPYAEVGSDKIIFQVPSSVIRSLNDPDTLMDFWDSVQDANADLANFSRDRPRAERFGGDRQISNGWMHSGYPIGYFDSYADELMDHQLMSTQGSWGPFHELGHNHQDVDWILPRTTEVTSNLWSVYVMEEVCGRPRWDAAWVLVNSTRISNMEAYFDQGTPFDEMPGETYFHLYMQLQEGFGWEPFMDVFAEYRTLPASQVPANDQERYDTWFRLFCNATKTNLAPFFENWRFPISQAELDAAAVFEPWQEDPLRDYFEYAADVSITNTTNATASSLRLNFDIHDWGHWNGSVTVYYDTADKGTTNTSWGNASVMGEVGYGAKYLDVTGLDGGTTYYFRVRVTTVWGEYWSGVGSGVTS